MWYFPNHRGEREQLYVAMYMYATANDSTEFLTIDCAKVVLGWASLRPIFIVGTCRTSNPEEGKEKIKKGYCNAEPINKVKQDAFEFECTQS